MPLNKVIECLTPGKALLLYRHIVKMQKFADVTRTGINKEDRTKDNEQAERFVKHVESPLKGWDKREYKDCHSILAKLYAICDTIDIEKLRKLAGL